MQLIFTSNGYDFWRDDDDGRWNAVPQGDAPPTHCSYASPVVIAGLKNVNLHLSEIEWPSPRKVDEVNWQPLVTFEDQTANYVHGFEAGIIWLRMQAGDAEITETTHPENRETLINIANVCGYAIEIEPSGFEGWDNLKATKRPKRGSLTIVK